MTSEEALIKIYWLVNGHEHKYDTEIREIIDKVQYLAWEGMKSDEQ